MLNKLLTKTNTIWDFPKLAIHDDSITKLDYITYYEDSHGSGNLESAKNFSYTTNNEDIWLLPSNSYLKLTCQIMKAEKDTSGGDDTEYTFSKTTDSVNITCNGNNIFSEARFFIDDVEVERIEHVGIATLINNLLVYDEAKERLVKYTEMWWQQSDGAAKRLEYVQDCNYTVNMLLPIDRIFPFFNQNRHVFRGIKHRITLTLNEPECSLYRDSSKTTKAAVLKIKNMTWQMPQLVPSLEVQAALETQLAQNSIFGLDWTAINVYKFQTSSGQENVRIPLSSTIHKPKHIFIGIQSKDRTTKQDEDSMMFEHSNLEYCNVEINSEQFPNKNIISNFADKNALELYNRFLDACPSTQLDYKTFLAYYPIVHIDVSKHDPLLYENTSFPSIVVNAKFRTAPTKDMIFWIVIFNTREATLNIQDKKMRIIK